MKALRLRRVMAREADALLARFDALAAPGRPTVAPPLDRDFRSALGGSVPDVMGAVGNGAGLPAVIVPNGFGDARAAHEPAADGPRVGGEHHPRRRPRLSGPHRLAPPAPDRAVARIIHGRALS